jgi:hypothetical protein
MTEEASTWTPNQWADFWRYQIGVNVMPTNTKDKKPLKGLSWESFLQRWKLKWVIQYVSSYVSV